MTLPPWAVVTPARRGHIERVAAPLQDYRVQQNRAYLVILLLSRVVVRLGDVERIAQHQRQLPFGRRERDPDVTWMTRALRHLRAAVEMREDLGRRPPVGRQAWRSYQARARWLCSRTHRLAVEQPRSTASWT